MKQVLIYLIFDYFGRHIFGYAGSLGLFGVLHSQQGRQIVEYLGREIFGYLGQTDIWIFGYTSDH